MVRRVDRPVTTPKAPHVERAGVHRPDELRTSDMGRRGEMDEREAVNDAGSSSDSDAAAESRVFPAIERRYERRRISLIGCDSSMRC
jgi:hypothetical protein